MWHFDLALSLASAAYLVALLLTDVLPPHSFDLDDGFIKEAFDSGMNAVFQRFHQRTQQHD